VFTSPVFPKYTFKRNGKQIQANTAEMYKKNTATCIPWMDGRMNENFNTTSTDFHLHV